VVLWLLLPPHDWSDDEVAPRRLPEG
jgi:hypothetical protein